MDEERLLIPAAGVEIPAAGVEIPAAGVKTPAAAAKNLKGEIWDESKKLWSIAFPAIICRISSFGMMVVTQAFMGHVSELDLASYALTQTIIVQFANGVLLGMSSATETLCGQAFGAKQYHMLGIYLQRSWIINIIVVTVISPIFIFTGQIFKALGQEDQLADVAGTIGLWFIPVMYAFIFSFTFQQFLQGQLKNKIAACLFAFPFLIHILLSWILVVKLGLGIPGAMGSLILSSWMVGVGGAVYVFGGWCKDTWTGFTKAAFYDLWPVFILSLSSGAMICLELWYNAILVLLAGYMQNAEVAISAFSICLNIIGWEFMIPLGFLGAACVRVANELGRGNAKAAKFATSVILCTSLLIGVVIWALCLVFGHQLAHLFTSSAEIVEYVSSLSVLLAFTVLLNSVQPVFSGVAVGAGRQSIVAYINVGSYYVIGIPIGAVLGYVADMKVKGIWIGLMCGVGLQTLILSYVTWRIDWNDEVKKAYERLHKWFLRPDAGENGAAADQSSERHQLLI